MARVRSKNTVPEMAVRRALHAAGLRYRIHREDLVGKPDIVLAGRLAAIFVHGCFWHSHSGCGRARTPSTHRDYWIPKLARNRERDAANERALTEAGWTVLVAWECEARNPEKLHGFVRRVADLPRRN